ncbi:D-methionine transport system substrate-binding protein [Paenibacillus cellulosilyticus]|uniref:Lipoprotein n=1 Tax=Paenibacillus cellulosilyticus TaxID=375489 RepID=A0A2V2YPZ4_9BACL|nr:MetQ/NlpA family ABC transporter substrate-binding protein [Paenibacillus cellulosilyticus]PWV97993.1 D-methionine transport system substrate-binding protein [Paenibacillus cellulosilyticus]QKS43981.1 MetQ/NlpA family ABC transporter substrate-binding protein [Paenibacillus cellulosilyticus]
MKQTKTWKQWTVLAVAMMMVFTLAACGSKKEETNNGTTNEGTTAEEVTLKVGATPVPHAEILKEIQPLLKEQGVNLEIVEFNDYVQPNVQVYEKQLDANFFQHTPYLEQFNKDKGYDLVTVTGVHLEPLGAYSKKITKVDELKDGAKVAIPNDATNGGRALSLLESNGLLKLKEGVGVNATVNDIIDNPKKLEIKELEAATLPRVLDEVDMAIINTNYALEADLVPTKDALFLESKDSPYVNILVARPDNKDSEAMQKLAKALNSDTVKKFIEEKYNGAVVAAF